MLKIKEVDLCEIAATWPFILSITTLLLVNCAGAFLRRGFAVSHVGAHVFLVGAIQEETRLGLTGGASVAFVPASSECSRLNQLTVGCRDSRRHSGFARANRRNTKGGNCEKNKKSFHVVQIH